MIRNPFKMKLKTGCVAEYKKRHDEIWPELSMAHTDAGICRRMKEDLVSVGFDSVVEGQQ